MLLGTLPRHRRRVPAALVMSYQYKGHLSIEQELAIAEQEKEEARQRIQERRAQLSKLRASRKQIEDMVAVEHRLVSEIHKLAAPLKTLPEPRYGGLAGLRAAAEEARGWSRTRNSRTRPERQAA
jgi:hypothetical protein